MTKRKEAEELLPRKGGPVPIIADPIESQSVIDAIVRGFGTDASMIDIAASAGISDRVLYRWRERGRIALEACGGIEANCPVADLPFLRLYMQTGRERAMRRIERREAIEEAGERDWRALAYLEDRADRMELLRGEADTGDVSDADIDAEIELMQETVEEFGFEMVRRRRTTTKRRTRKRQARDDE